MKNVNMKKYQAMELYFKTKEKINTLKYFDDKNYMIKEFEKMDEIISYNFIHNDVFDNMIELLEKVYGRVEDELDRIYTNQDGY